MLKRYVEMEMSDWATEFRETLEALVYQLSGKGSASDLLPYLTRPLDEEKALEEVCHYLLKYAAASGGHRLLLVPGRGGVVLKPLTEETEDLLAMPDELLSRLTALLKMQASMSGGVGSIGISFERRAYDVMVRCIPAPTGERLSLYVVSRI